MTIERLDWFRCDIQRDGRYGDTSTGNETGNLDLMSVQGDTKNK